MNTQPSEARRPYRRFLWLGAGGFLLGLLITFFATREATEKLTSELLVRARAQWNQAEIRDYELRYRMNGSEYRVSVRDGLVVAATVNGQAAASVDLGAYSVDGLFRTLEQEIENFTDPSGPFAGSSQSIVARARFHPRMGYLERYVRSAAGQGRGVLIELVEFKSIAHSAAQ